ncbi:uncharacterized protein LOC110436340 isoform X4 [Sorghum bicolor]|uniref:uncharacterized protein LOC110436340 isoform X4 n=1 Tax=Sorghum bicolor TaxID=4558 RepID=UPI000B42521B|nr:uncharacterized protein LOC110436340 isoform X4 [Sorghum bicolor]|eukprot:XP_021318850.1 uncharacterized protein LOC110436340 isoform X4 [Sorghum bicolor]
MCFGWLIMALDCHANLCRCPKWQIIEGCACANSKPFAPICRASLVPPSPGQSAVLPSWPQSPPSAVALLHVYHPLPTSPRHPATQTCKSATPLLLTTNTTASRPSARRSGGVGGEKRRRAKLPARPPPRAHAPTHKHLEVPSGLHWANSVLRLICTARPVESAEARARVAKLGLAAVLAGVGAVRRRHLHDLLRARIPRHTTRAPARTLRPISRLCSVAIPCRRCSYFGPGYQQRLEKHSGET